MKKKRKQLFEAYNHRIIWGAAERNLELASSSREDARYFALGAMFLYFAAFEGYLNWLGSHIAPEVWKEERLFFSRSPFQGTLGKYRFLAKILHLPNPDSSQRPFQTANNLRKLRDMVAHPKMESGERQVSVQGGCSPPHYQSAMEKKATPKAASHAKGDLEELAEGLHREAKRCFSNVYESSAFGPFLGTEITELETLSSSGS